MSRTRIAAAVVSAALGVATGIVMRWEPKPGPSRHIAYQDLGGAWTICDGRTRGVTPGMRATPEQCDAWREEDLLVAHEAIERCITWPLTVNQRGALISAVYNLGPAVVCGSTLQRKANAGDMEGACRELTHARNSDGGNRGWSFVGSKYYQGLRNRRFDERAVCWPDFGGVIAGSASVPQ